jgi:hypothetical protein
MTSHGRGDHDMVMPGSGADGLAKLGCIGNTPLARN